MQLADLESADPSVEYPEAPDDDDAERERADRERSDRERSDRNGPVAQLPERRGTCGAAPFRTAIVVFHPDGFKTRAQVPGSPGREPCLGS